MLNINRHYSKGRVCGDCGKLITNYAKKCSACNPRKNLFTSKMSGVMNYSWKGGKTIKDGYIFVRTPKHPYAQSNGYIAEHRLIMEKYLKRYLKPEELVHHINKIKTDNSLENLELITASEHIRKHYKGVINKKGINGYTLNPRHKFIECAFCYKKIRREFNQLGKHNFCSKKCHYSYKRGKNRNEEIL